MPPKLDAELGSAAPVFAALGDRTRLRILARLMEGEPLSIARLSEGAGVTRQAVTKHLNVLSEARLIHGARRGRERVWHLDPTRLDTARGALARIAQEWDARLVRLKQKIEGEQKDS